MVNLVLRALGLITDLFSDWVPRGVISMRDWGGAVMSRVLAPRAVELVRATAEDLEA